MHGTLCLRPLELSMPQALTLHVMLTSAVLRATNGERMSLVPRWVGERRRLTTHGAARRLGKMSAPLNALLDGEIFSAARLC